MDRSILLAKLAAVREKAVEDSKLPDPFPLAALLTIYCKAQYECYIDYMRGAVVLIQALAPIELPEVPDSFTCPALLGGYELNQLASIISTISGGYNLSYQARVRRAISYCLITSIKGVSYE